MSRRGDLLLHLVRAAHTGRGMRLTNDEVKELAACCGVTVLQSVSPSQVKADGLSLDEGLKAPDWAKIDPVRHALMPGENAVLGTVD